MDSENSNKDFVTLGNLYKWSGYIKGFQKRWFIIKNGILYIYRSKSKANGPCYHKITIADAEILHMSETNFSVKANGKSALIKCQTNAEKKRSMLALEIAKNKALSRKNEKENELQSTISTLKKKLQDLNVYNELLKKQSEALSRSLSVNGKLEPTKQNETIIRNLNEKAAIYKNTVDNMIRKCETINNLVDIPFRKLSSLSESEKNEPKSPVSTTSCLKHMPSRISAASSFGEYYDAIEDTSSMSENFTSTLNYDTSTYNHNDKKEEKNKKNTNNNNNNEVSSCSEITENSQKINSEPVTPKKVQIVRRKTLPEKPDGKLNIWSMVKNMIGQDIYNISIPVTLSEPVSMLQRITEELEYTSLLDKAATCKNQWEQMAYVAAFTVTANCASATRTTKPFNPVLGETFECDRFDEPGFGWRSIVEQVSHKPSKLAFHAESSDWVLYHELNVHTKFRGHYLEVIPYGTTHLEFKKSGEHYTWRRVKNFVRNVIMGKLWIENAGEVDIINHTTKDICHLKYYTSSYFSSSGNLRRVSGIISDAQSVARYVLNGTWTEEMNCSPVLNPQHISENTQLNLGKTINLWKCKKHELSDKTYMFTPFTIELNEPDEDVAPTDSRNRSDIRLMEDGKWMEASHEKIRFEEKSEELHRIYENGKEEASKYRPTWFKKVKDPFTGEMIYGFNNQYWECKMKKDWKRCPKLFNSS